MSDFTDEIAKNHFLVGQAPGSPVSPAQCTCKKIMSSNGAYALHLAEVVGDASLVEIRKLLFKSDRGLNGSLVELDMDLFSLFSSTKLK